jgi:hypothetical protein
MKKILTLILMVACVLAIKAQSFVFVKDGVELSNNAAYEVSELDRAGIIESGLELVNKTNNTIGVIVSQTVLIAPSAPDAVLSICFDVCKTTNGNTSLTGNLGVEPNPFHVYFAPDREYSDQAVVKYEVVNSSDPSDKIAATVTYKYSDGTRMETIESDKVLKIFQNGNQIIFNTQLINKKNLRVSVYNIAGHLKASQALPNSGEIALETNLEKGVYIAFLADGDGTIKTKKFIIYGRF